MVLALDKWKREENTRFGCQAGAKGGSPAQQRGIEYHRKFYRTLAMHVAACMPGWRLLVEPWYKNMNTRVLRSPDGVLLNDEHKLGLVVEAKMNWADGRDVKLLDEYLPIVKSAHELASVKPLLVTGNLRGYQRPPLLGLRHLDRALEWQPGQPTPLMLWLR